MGAENFFLFGLTAAEVTARRAEPHYARRAIEMQQQELVLLEGLRKGVISMPFGKLRQACRLVIF